MQKINRKRFMDGLLLSRINAIQQSKRFWLLVIMFIFMFPCSAQNRNERLQSRIDSILQGKQMTVGIYADWGREVFGLNENERFPMMSVFKIHVVLAALDQIADIDSIVHIKRRQIRENTYSPMREDFPEGDIDISVGQLVNYAISMSDNNACDILISLAGGVRKIDRYIRRLGIKDFQIKETEASMHKDVRRVYGNWSTPRAMTELLQMLPNKFSYSCPLLQAMRNATTGKNKMQAAVSDSLVLYHKTGSSDHINGIKTAENDCGIIKSHNGKNSLFISIFIKESAENDNTNAEVIASITRAVILEQE